MSFGRRSGFFQPMTRFTGGTSVTETVTITRTLVNTTAVSFSFSNANLPNANIAYSIVGADTADFTDGAVIGQIQLDATGAATLIKTIVTTEDIGVDKSFYISVYKVNNRVTGTSANVNIGTSYPFVATGGNSFTQNGNVYHVFTANGNLTVSQLNSGSYLNTELRTLIVARGGDAGLSIAYQDGGGGAGGLKNANVNSNTFTLTTYPVVVGTASLAGTGANSSFKGVTVLGGGYGAGANVPGGAGGSGGGGASRSSSPTAGTAGGSGTAGQGFAGGSGSTVFASGGGGGGGAGGPGYNGAHGTLNKSQGGPGVLVDWVPSGYGDTVYPKYFAGGGYGEGAGVASQGNTGANTGGGGNVASGQNSGKSGIVILAYPANIETRYLNLP